MRVISSLAAAVALAAGPFWAAEPAVHLSDLVREALDHNPEILAAQKRVQAAQQRPAQAASLPDPMISLGWQSNGNPLPGAGLGRDVTSNLGLMYTQDIPNPAKRRLRGELGRKESEAEFAQYELTRLAVISRLGQAYHKLHHTYESEQVLDRNRDLLRTLLRISEARYSAGKAMQQDIFKVQTEITIVETKRLQIFAERRARTAEINALLGRPRTAGLGEPAGEHQPALGVTLDDLLARARELAPAMLREQRMVERAEIAVNLARKEYATDYTVSAGYFNQGSMPPMFTVRTDIRLPVFSTRRQRAGIAEQVESLSQSRRTYQSTEQTLEARIIEDFTIAETALRILAIYRDTAIPQAKLAFESSLASYQTGAGDFLSVFNNHLAEVEHEMNYHEQMLTFYLAASRLEEMTGMEVGRP